MVKRKLVERINYDFETKHERGAKTITAHRDIYGKFLGKKQYNKRRVDTNTYNVAIRKALRKYSRPEIDNRTWKKVYNEVRSDVNITFNMSMLNNKKIMRKDKLSGRQVELIEGKEHLATLANIRETATIREGFRASEKSATTTREREKWRRKRMAISDFNYVLVVEYGSG